MFYNGSPFSLFDKCCAVLSLAYYGNCVRQRNAIYLGQPNPFLANNFIFNFLLRQVPMVE